MNFEEIKELKNITLNREFTKSEGTEKQIENLEKYSIWIP